MSKTPKRTRHKKKKATVVEDNRHSGLEKLTTMAFQGCSSRIGGLWLRCNYGNGFSSTGPNSKLSATWCLIHFLNAKDPSYDEESTTNKMQSTTFEFGSLWAKVGKQDNLCLTGYMTDVQNWVDGNGNLNPRLHSRDSIDVSSKQDPVSKLQQEMLENRKVLGTATIKYLSISRCNLRRVPSVFNLSDTRGRTLYSTVEYLTLYGNEFVTVSNAGVAFTEAMNATDALKFSDNPLQWPGSPAWEMGLKEGTFDNLRELDLRKCNIQKLADNIFRNMPKLEALYLGENQISHISTDAFRGLNNLLHLDLSRNFYYTDNKSTELSLNFEHGSVFSSLRKLQSLDMSLTSMSLRDTDIFVGLHGLTRLSICGTGLFEVPNVMTNNSSIRILDVSGNNGILGSRKPLLGLENSLQVLYAKEIGLRTFNIFQNFEKLQILDIESNEVSEISRVTTKSLKNLQILNLNKNRLTAWFNMTFSYMKQLQFMSIKENNINVITPDMIADMQNISYIGLSGNFFICNCQSRELFEIAYRNDNKTYEHIHTRVQEHKPFSFHTGFDDFNKQIESRQNLVRICEGKNCEGNEDKDTEGNFMLIDFADNKYHCLPATESETIPFSQVNTCSQTKRDTDYSEIITESRKQLLALIIIPILLFPVLIFCFVFRRNLRYFWITIKNSATLSLIHKHEIIDDGTIFYYDVFVSYCNDDRNWVLDELLPNLEKGCNINVCLHERDFQVGLSILENIVSCMDRSRSILLIISKQFLMSQWCQFEMHLAQHRLLETRREDLILVLLEDIPRSLRPTTLHYLMLTKTYIIWPKKEGDHQAFWKRLSGSILTRRQISQDNISVA